MAEEPKTKVMTKIDAMVAQAIYEDMDEEKRSKLITDALSALMKKEYTTYGGSQPSELEAAFHSSVAEQARKIVKEKFDQDEGVQNQIKKVIEEAVSKALSGEAREKLINNMAESVADAFKLKDRY